MQLFCCLYMMILIANIRTYSSYCFRCRNNNRFYNILPSYSLLTPSSTTILTSLSSSTSTSSSSLSSTSSKTLPAQYLSNHRFWSRTHYIDTNNNISFSNIQHKLEEIENDFNKVEVGIVIIDEKTLIPIQSGKLQLQHTVSIDGKLNTNDVFTNNKVKAFLCAFAPRAETICISPNEEERPIDLERLKSLDKALLQLTSTTAEELLSELMAGTPPAKIYRSFVSPRPKAVHILEPIERAANRTAAQIELALRQVRADQASYLRNTDKALQSVFQIKSKSEDDKYDSIEEYQTSNEKEGNSFHRKTINPVVLVLDNVRSAFNVGSLFRTGETAGIAELITVGITCKPPHPKLRKTALNSIDVVPSRHFDDIMDCIETLKREGYTIISMETTDKSLIYTEVDYPRNVALILGNEVMGVDTRVMDKSDYIVEIPMFGVKNSLNVASAGPIVLFEVLRQWNKK